MSEDRAKMYSDAADRVEHKWVRGTLNDGYGGVCLIGGIMTARGTWASPPKAVIDEIGRRLMFSPGYLAIRLIGSATDDPRVRKIRAIERWNDCFWRRKRRIVHLLRSLAEANRPKPLYPNLLDQLGAEKHALEARVELLETQKTVLEQRLARLEAENAHLWRRLFSQRDLTSDREILEALDAELEEAFAKIDALS
jgi:hypothetical protein